MRNRAAAVFFLLLAPFALQIVWAASDYYPPPDSKGGWRSLTGESSDKLLKVAGMDRAKLDEAFQLSPGDDSEWRLGGGPPWLPCL